MTRKAAAIPIASAFLIYGLIDPKTRLIRYVGLSSSGLQRPKQHRARSCPNTYCRRWVKILQRSCLDYEITVLETMQTAAGLAEAERWWIKFGKACGWPLTNRHFGHPPASESSESYDRRPEPFGL